jgi:ATP-dependent helicase/nuclease subunit A
MNAFETLSLFDGDLGDPALTPEQRDAVRRREGSLLLSASAGSGKTSVLVERYVAAVVQDGLAPAQILAITFTDRAAGEMRERLRARLLSIGARDAARDAEGAFVMTIHGFASRLLRANPLAAGLDPAFTILDADAAERLRQQAFADALARFLPGPEGPGPEGGRPEGGPALDLVAAFGVDRIAGLIGALHEELRSRGLREPRLPAIPVPPPAGPARARLGAACADLQRELCAAAGPGAPVRMRAALDTLERCRELLEEPSADDIVEPGRLADLGINAGNMRALQCDALPRYSEALSAYASACSDHRAAAALLLVDELLAGYGSRYGALKRDRSALDFDDLELEARDLLASDAALRAQWVERFELIMVDEFQDTNPRQLELLALLERDNLFTVGDEFQSIYGFRHADVGIFRARRAAMAADGAATSLTANFRSLEPLLTAVNRVFEPRFGAAFTPLARGRVASPDASPGQAAVELLITDTRGWDEAEPATTDGASTTVDSLPPGTAWRHAEARFLAARIEELVGGGHYEAGDIAVLVRATGDLLIYERALEERNLPTLAAGAGGYWSRQQVRVLTAYLALLANPLDDHALYSVLASPLVGLSSDALALIGLAATPGTGAWVAIERGLELGPEDARRLQGFRGWLASERALAGRLGLETLIERCVRGRGYDLHILGLSGGERRLANVHKLMRLARAYEAAEGRDLRGFADHAARHERAQARDPDAPVQDPDLDAVRLMSIHNAKGLEFGVVCLADLGRQGRTDTPPVLVGPEGVGAKLPTLDGSEQLPALGYERLRERRLEAEAQEEARVMYVGMTRARDHLILSGAVDAGRWPEDRPGACPISWLGPALVPGIEAALGSEDPEPAIVSEAAARAGVRVSVNSPASAAAAAPAVAAEPVVFAARAAASPPAPLPAAQAPSSVSLAALSYTALSSYSQCGYRFYVQRVLGLPDEPPGPEGDSERGDPRAADSLDPRVRGVVVHALLEELEFAQPELASGAAVDAAAARHGERLTAAQARECATLALAFAGSPLCERLATAEDVRREHPFSLEIGPGRPLLTGVIDVLGRASSGALLVVDYKTDRIEGLTPEAHVAAHYELQRAIYALAALRAGAPEVEVAHCFLERAAEPATARFATPDRAALEQQLGVLMDRLGEGAFPVAAEPHRGLCLTCPARRRLCSWDESMTLREGGTAAGPATS